MKIEVRAWHEINQEMIYPSRQLSNAQIISGFDDENIMLKSSYTDKKGKPIYDGDIITRDVNAPWDSEVPIWIRQVITFGDPYPDTFCLKSVLGDDNTGYLHDIGDANYVADCIIIGNIYQNKNALK
jgi:hypothetical protein